MHGSGRCHHVAARRGHSLSFLSSSSFKTEKPGCRRRVESGATVGCTQLFTSVYLAAPVQLGPRTRDGSAYAALESCKIGCACACVCPCVRAHVRVCVRACAQAPPPIRPPKKNTPADCLPALPPHARTQNLNPTIVNKHLPCRPCPSASHSPTQPPLQRVKTGRGSQVEALAATQSTLICSALRADTQPINQRSCLSSSAAACTSTCPSITTYFGPALSSFFKPGVLVPAQGNQKELPAQPCTLLCSATKPLR